MRQTCVAQHVGGKFLAQATSPSSPAHSTSPIIQSPYTEAIAEGELVPACFRTTENDVSCGSLVQPCFDWPARPTTNRCVVKMNVASDGLPRGRQSQERTLSMRAISPIVTFSDRLITASRPLTRTGFMHNASTHAP